jgi:hypothetical protein
VFIAVNNTEAGFNKSPLTSTITLGRKLNRAANNDISANTSVNDICINPPIFTNKFATTGDLSALYGSVGCRRGDDFGFCLGFRLCLRLLDLGI